MKRDVVCGLAIEESVAAEAGLMSEYEDQTYCFCGYKCKERFDAEPALFTEPTLDEQRQDNEGGPAYAG